MERTKDFLKPLFKDGERPSGADFGDLIDSFVNKQSDGVLFDADGNLVLNRGVRLGDSAGAVAGGLRFNNNQLQVFTGGAWVNVASGGGGGFQAPPTTATAPVAHNGNVGIGPFPADPTFRLEVPLDANNGPANQVRFGNVVCSNGAGLINKDFAVFAHQQHAATNVVNSNFALRQAPTGEVQLNAPPNQIVSIRQGGVSARLGISASGNVIVGGEADLLGAGAAIFQVAGSAFKNDGSAAWTFSSDARVKDDVQDLELGLAELRQVRTVRFRYNGRGGTPAGQAGVGVLGQEIETIVPETVKRVSVANDPELDDMRVFDPSALTYVLINAVKELTARVEHLEQALAARQGKRSPGR
jgi:hypothetical protein